MDLVPCPRCPQIEARSCNLCVPDTRAARKHKGLAKAGAALEYTLRGLEPKHWVEARAIGKKYE